MLQLYIIMHRSMSQSPAQALAGCCERLQTPAAQQRLVSRNFDPHTVLLQHHATAYNGPPTCYTAKNFRGLQVLTLLSSWVPIVPCVRKRARDKYRPVQNPNWKKERLDIRERHDMCIAGRELAQP